MNIYSNGEMLPLSGAYCSFTYGAVGAKEVDFDYNIQGLAGVTVDATAPARIFPASGTVAPTAKNCQLSIGGMNTLVVRSHKFTYTPTISPRIDQNALNGHSGFDIVGGDFTAVFVVEAPSKSTVDFDSDRDNATLKAITLQVGSATGNTMVTSIPNAVLTDVKRQNTGNITEYELTYMATVSGPDTADNFSITIK
jgi:hypothetical protein